jgi:hypothetical protein
MANQLFPQGAAHILGKTAALNCAADVLKIMFYAGAFNPANEYVADLTPAQIIARSVQLTGITTTNGTLACNNVTLTAVSGAPFAQVFLYKDTGADSSSPLVANFDIVSFAPTGADVSVVFNAAGLFSIA